METAGLIHRWHGRRRGAPADGSLYGGAGLGYSGCVLTRAGAGREVLVEKKGNGSVLKKVLIGVAAVLGILLIVIATRPSTFHIERSTTMSAPPESAFAQVNDFRAWSAWSPWDKLDPGMKRTYEGAPSGAGARYGWTGNDKVGEGRMTIEKSERPSLISIKLEFIKPFASTNQTTFSFAPAGGGTKVTWAMDGHNDFMGKAFSLFMDMDKMVGADFERGLAAMKTAAESAPKPVADPTKPAADPAKQSP